MFFQRSFSPVFLVLLSSPIFIFLRDVSLSNNRELLLNAICIVESGGNPNALGDKGKSRGAYQIQQACWVDSRYPEPYLPNVWDMQKSRQVCRMYCERFAGKNASNEHWARVWNGGPNGCKKKATLGYWLKVKKAMKELRKKNKV